MGPSLGIRVGLSSAVAVLLLLCLFLAPAQAAPQTSSEICVQSGTGLFHNNAFPMQESQFSVSFAATPNEPSMYGLVGFSLNAATTDDSLAAIVRFAKNGNIDVRNGNNFNANVTFPYKAGQQYQFQMVINPATKRYSVFVTAPGGTQTQLANNYEFRATLLNISGLNNWTAWASSGSESVCNMTIGSVTSTAAVAPTITSQPLSQTIIAGQTATFSVVAAGTSPLAYQWRKNGMSISGATASSYTTPAETTSDNGAQFTVVVSNSAGTVTSVAATLTVTAPGTLTSSASTLAFSSINIGSSSALTATLTNSGSSSVTVSGVTISGPGFNVTGISVGQVIRVGQTATLSVTFAPAATGSVTGSVTVTSNASNSPTIISLSGTGAAVLHSADLTWVASTSVVTGYNVYRGTVAAGPFTKLTSSFIPALTYTDTSVQAGQTYYYVVTSVNSSNAESVYSNEVSATIP